MTSVENEKTNCCFKCKSIDNLKTENINELEKVIICKECYDKNKCSICYELFEGEPYKLHDDIECCSEVNLCKTCRDHLREIKVTACPVCKNDPMPQQEEQITHNIYILSREYNYINTHSFDWITTFTGRDYNSYYFNNEGVKIPLQYYLENEIINFKDRFYSYQFNYLENEDMLLMKICFYCSYCPNMHFKLYKFDNSLIDNENSASGGTVE